MTTARKFEIKPYKYSMDGHMFITSAMYGDMKRIEALLAKGTTDVDGADFFGETALHWAAYRGHIAIMHSLLKHRANVNIRDNVSYRTPLHLASYDGHVEAMKVLLSGGADVNAQTKFGRTALHWAATEGHGPAVQTLIASGASLNLQDDCWGETALHCAASEGHPTVVKMLLSAGAQTDIRDKDGNTALDVARSEHQASVVAILEAL
eukprot:Em0002g1435a